MNHQVEDLTRFSLELKSLGIGAHGRSLLWQKITIANRRVYAMTAREGTAGLLMLGVQQSCFTRVNMVAAIRRLPFFEIGAKNEEFPANLDNPNALFLNDSAEMPN